MFSKLLNISRISTGLPTSVRFGQASIRGPRVIPVRGSALIPPTQYDIPWPKKMQLGTLLTNNWEIIPLFSVTAFAIAILLFSIGWAVKTKVDVVYGSHQNKDALSRTMNLRNPPTLKLITINQKYEPWPEMQDAVDKIRDAEKKLLLIMNSCQLG